MTILSQEQSHYPICHLSMPASNHFLKCFYYILLIMSTNQVLLGACKHMQIIIFWLIYIYHSEFYNINIEQYAFQLFLPLNSLG